jgi:N-acetylglucosamine malate deacetylase 1
MSKYLFIGAHVDDVELSCGGTISKLIEEGNDVTVVTLSYMYGDLDLLAEWNESMIDLNVKNILYKDFRTRLFSEQRQDILDFLCTLKGFDYVFTHSANEIHQDHKVVGEESLRAFKHTNLITYTGDWNQRTITKNYFVRLNADHVESKVLALVDYVSQRDRPYMKLDYIWANARNMGVMAGCEFAEGFEAFNIIA